MRTGVGAMLGVALAVWLCARGRAEPTPPPSTRSAPGCRPVVARATSTATGHFIARDRAAAVKEARSFGYRIATERVVRQVERQPLRCRRGCVAGEPEIRTGFEDSVPCRHGALDRTKRAQADWAAACRDSLDYQKQCDRPEVRADKPAWAECEVAVWAEKTLPCRCRKR